MKGSYEQVLSDYEKRVAAVRDRNQARKQKGQVLLSEILVWDSDAVD